VFAENELRKLILIDDNLLQVQGTVATAIIPLCRQMHQKFTIHPKSMGYYAAYLKGRIKCCTKSVRQPIRPVPRFSRNRKAVTKHSVGQE